MDTLDVLGMDYGSSNGRGIIGSFDGNRLSIKEIYRFENNPVTVFSSIYWNLLGLFTELKTTMIKAKSLSLNISSIGIDNWASDFGILDGQGYLLGNPHCYRDSRTEDITEEAYKVFSEYEIFSKTGMLPHHRHTLFQLISMKHGEKSILEKGKTLLFISGLLNYFLTGNVNCDSTQASSSVLYNPFTNNWNKEFLHGYRLPDLLPPLDAQGCIIGKVTDSIMEQTGIGRVPVISIAQHDSASAIAAVTAVNKQDIVYISSGTWSVIGTTVEKPIISEDVLKKGFNNEIGYNNEIMFVKNITGLWVLQECIREWKSKGHTVNYRHLENYAGNSSFSSKIDIEDDVFMQPGNMIEKVCSYCRKTAQTVPESMEDIYTCIINGLVFKYKEVIHMLSKMTNKKFKEVHIVGGGSKDSYLCKKTAEVTRMRVVAGPEEATVLGNIAAQLISLGEVKDINQARHVLRDSFEQKTYED